MKKIKVKGDAMEVIRTRGGFSVRQLAIAIKINAAALHRIENGEGHPLPSTAKAICDTLGRDFDDLFELVEVSTTADSTTVDNAAEGGTK